MKRVDRYKEQQKAYAMRVRTRMKWTDIVTHTNYTCISSVVDGAKAYAKREGKPWPPPEALSMGEMAYYDYQDGESWEEIRKTLQLGFAGQARRSAYSWATRKGLPWPPREETEETVEQT